MGQLDPYALAICAAVFGAVLVGTVAAGIQQRRIDRRDLRITALSAELAKERVAADVLYAERDRYADQVWRLTPKRKLNGQFTER